MSEPRIIWIGPRIHQNQTIFLHIISTISKTVKHLYPGSYGFIVSPHSNFQAGDTVTTCELEVIQLETKAEFLREVEGLVAALGQENVVLQKPQH